MKWNAVFGFNGASEKAGGGQKGTDAFRVTVASDFQAFFGNPRTRVSVPLEQNLPPQKAAESPRLTQFKRYQFGSADGAERKR